MIGEGGVVRLLVFKFGGPRFNQRMEFVNGGPEFNSSASYLNSQLVSLKPVGIFNQFLVLFPIFVSRFIESSIITTVSAKLNDTLSALFNILIYYDRGVINPSNLQD